MKVLLVIVALLFVLLIGGCGLVAYTTRVASDEFVKAIEQLPTTGSTFTAQPAQRAWVRGVNAACARRNNRVRAIAPPRGGLKDLRRYASAVLEVQRAHRREVDALRRPRGRHLAFVAESNRQQERALRGVIAAAAAGNAAAADRAVTRYDSVLQLTGAAFRGVGLDVCAELG